MRQTPGPWRVINRVRQSKQDSYGRAAQVRETFINGADGLGSIAKLYIGHDSDARLIAAAPELLNALIAIVALDDGDKPDLWHFEKEFQAGRAAIAKAKVA